MLIWPMGPSSSGATALTSRRGICACPTLLEAFSFQRALYLTLQPTAMLSSHRAKQGDGYLRLRST